MKTIHIQSFSLNQTFEVICLFSCEHRNNVCAYLKGEQYNVFYELDNVNNLAYPTGVYRKTLVERINSGNTFSYYRKKYKKLSLRESIPYFDKVYKHVVPIGPDCLEHLWFQP